MPEGEEMFQYHGYSGKCPSPQNKPDPTNGEEKMREIREKWAAFAMRNGTDLNLDFRVTSDWWLAQLKQSHLALLEQIVAKNETFPNCPALKEINTDLRAKIEELKKQGGIVN